MTLERRSIAPVRGRRVASMSLVEVTVVAGLWGVLASVLASTVVLSSRGLAEAERAATLCRAAAALERELGEAVRVLKPGPAWSACQLVLQRSDGRAVTIGVEEGRLVARSPANAPARVLADRLDHALFRGHPDSRAVVRYQLVLEDRCLITAARTRGHLKRPVEGPGSNAALGLGLDKLGPNGSRGSSLVAEPQRTPGGQP